MLFVKVWLRWLSLVSPSTSCFHLQDGVEIAEDGILHTLELLAHRYQLRNGVGHFLIHHGSIVLALLLALLGGNALLLTLLPGVVLLKFLLGHFYFFHNLDCLKGFQMLFELRSIVYKRLELIVG